MGSADQAASHKLSVKAPQILQGLRIKKQEDKEVKFETSRATNFAYMKNRYWNNYRSNSKILDVIPEDSEAGRSPRQTVELPIRNNDAELQFDQQGGDIQHENS